MAKVSNEELQKRITELGPWFYNFDFGDGVTTTSAVPEAVTQIFETRLEMIAPVIYSHFGTRLSSIECLDVGCHEGYYSLAMARGGARHVTGIDAREENLERARFVAEAMGLSDKIEYRPGRVEGLPLIVREPYPLVLFLGVLYHVENPMLCLRNIARATGELCLVETQVIDEVEGAAEWGSREWTRPYQGVIALIDETGEFEAGIRETGITPMATCPTPKALEFMLKQAGFSRIERVPPPEGAYEQHARGKRVVYAAWK